MASLAEAKDWIRRAVENARQVIESKNEEGWAAPLPPGQTVAAIVCGFALCFRSIEDLKNAQRADLGVLLGTAQAPTVLVLRQKIQTLVESVDPAALARACFQHYLALEPVSEGLYYADGHFCPYV